MKYPITAVILAKNEEYNIDRCLLSLTFCSDLVLVDDFSVDNTVKLAEKHHVRVLEHKLEGDFAAQRNFALKQVKEEWVLYVDADEVITPELKKNIIAAVTDKSSDSTKVEAYYIKRRDFWWGTEMRYGETQKVRNKGIIRLIRKNSGQWMGNVHEVFHTAKNTETLDGFLNHHPHPGVKDFLHDINEYSTLRAKELMQHGVRTTVIQIIFYPFLKFVLNYVVYFGFMDGASGFAYAFFMSFHSFLVRSKLYQYHLSTSNPKWQKSNTK